MSKLAVALNRFMAKRQGQLAQLWSFDSKSSLLAAPQAADIDADGQFEVVFGTKGGKIYALANDGALKWHYDITEQFTDVELMFLDTESMNSIESTPALGDLDSDGKKEIIFGSELGFVYCLSSAGQLLWKFKCDGAVKGGITLRDINGDGQLEVLFGSSDTYFYALDSRGKLVWRHQCGAAIESTPAVVPHARLIVFGDNQGRINAITFDCEPRWAYPTEGKVLAKPAIGALDGAAMTIVVGSVDNTLYALSEAGELRWKYETEGALVAEAELADLNRDGKLEIVVGSCDNNVHAVNFRGEKLWTYETNFWVVSKPIVADLDGDGRLEVIAGSYDHNLYVLDAEGTYMLDHIPGLSSVVPQAGHYAEVLTSEPGESAGKKIWQYDTEGVIVGCAYVEDVRNIILNTKVGAVKRISHQA